jgi:hypothetical protein
MKATGSILIVLCVADLFRKKLFANYEFPGSTLCASSTLSAYVFLLPFLLLMQRCLC